MMWPNAHLSLSLSPFHAISYISAFTILDLLQVLQRCVSHALPRPAGFPPSPEPTVLVLLPCHWVGHTPHLVRFFFSPNLAEYS